METALCNPQADLFNTDIHGVLQLANEIFGGPQAPGGHRQELVILSDMRQHTAELDLETAEGIKRAVHSPLMAQRLLNFTDAKLYCMGVDGAGESFNLWQERKEQWGELIRRSNGTEVDYSALRVLSLFQPAGKQRELSKTINPGYSRAEFDTDKRI